MPREDMTPMAVAIRPSSTSNILLSRAIRRSKATDSTPSKAVTLHSRVATPHSNINRATLSSSPTASKATAHPHPRVHLHPYVNTVVDVICSA